MIVEASRSSTLTLCSLESQLNNLDLLSSAKTYKSQSYDVTGVRGQAAMPTQPDCLQSSNKSLILLDFSRCRTVEKQGVDRLHDSWSGGCQ